MSNGVKAPTEGQKQAIMKLQELMQGFHDNKIIMNCMEAGEDGTMFKISLQDAETTEHLAEFAYMTIPMLGNQAIAELTFVSEK